MTGCQTKKKRGGTWLNNLILRDFFIGGAALFRETHFWLQYICTNAGIFFWLPPLALGKAG
jgi:hypothetical protein